MLLDRATCDANHRRFVERVVESQTVWYLQSKDGVANSCSNDDEDITILMFWSDRPYATRAKNGEFEEYGEASMDLFDLLFRWLPGMSGDGVLAGANWTGDLIGVESDPFELREEIEAAMPKELLRKHKERYDAFT